MELTLEWFGWFIVKYIYLYLIVIALSSLEIQIEGEYGWTVKLPTWRVKSRIFGYFMGGKELTGYLFYLLMLILLFLHFPFFVGVPWTFEGEIEIIMLFLLFSVFWDAMWFVINPYFGVTRFKKEYVYWHHQWIWGIPLDYPRGVIISLMISFLAYPLGLVKWALAFGTFMILTLAVIGVNQLQRKNPNYWKRHDYMKENSKT